MGNTASSGCLNRGKWNLPCWNAYRAPDARPLPSGQGDLLGGLAAMQEKKENGAAGLPGVPAAALPELLRKPPRAPRFQRRRNRR